MHIYNGFYGSAAVTNYRANGRGKNKNK